MDIFLQLAAEWPHVRQAPHSMLVVAVAAFLIAWAIIHLVYETRVENRDSMIKLYQAAPPAPVQDSQPTRKEEVVGKTFRNERVPLDGKSYLKCRFENVTFVYNGTGPWTLVGNKLMGVMRVNTESPAVAGAMSLLRLVGFLKPTIRYEDSGVEPMAVRLIEEHPTQT